MGFLSKVWNAITGTVKAIIKNPVTAIAAVALAIYAPGIGLRLLGSMVLTNLLAPKPPEGGSDGNSPNQGNQQTLQPNTNNKIPMVYGKAFISPVIVDAKISTDNQTMWYVLALCEAPDAGESEISFSNIYYDEKLVTYTPGTGAATKLTDVNGAEDTKVADNMWLYFYNGSATPINGTTQTAYEVLSDTLIPVDARWVSGSQKMTNTIFMVVKLKYSTDDNITGLGNFIVEFNNYQNGITDGYKPGSAMIDYLMNARYGADFSYDSVDTQSFLDLDTYSEEVITFYDTNGVGATQPRYRFNGVVDTSQSVLTNLTSMADSCDSYISYNETSGKWSVVINKSFLQAPNQVAAIDDLFLLDNSNIIGGVNIAPLDLNSTPNESETTFFNYKSRGKQDFAYSVTPDRLKALYEPTNRLQTKFNFVNDSVRAQYLTNRKLEQCRADYIVDLTTDYSAIHLDAGDIIRLTYEPHGGSIPAAISSISGDGTTVTVVYNSTEITPYHVGQTVTIQGVLPLVYNNTVVITSIALNTFTYAADTIDAVSSVSNAQVVSGLSWTNKPFRVMQVQELRSDDGSLTCKLQLNEYSEQVYDNWNINDYNVPLNNYLVDVNVLSKPIQPEIVEATISVTGSPPTFQVKGTTPTTGITVALEFWYSTMDAINPTLNNYVLWEVQYNSSKPQYGVSQEEIVTVSGLEAGTYYWRTRAIGSNRKSEFSDSVEFIWEPVAVDSNVGGNGGKADLVDMLPAPWTNGSSNWPNNTRSIMPAGGVSLITSGNPGSVRVNFSSSIYAASNSEYNCMEVWKTVASKVYSRKIYSIRHSYDSTTAGSASQRIQAVGTNMDYISDDGGTTWSQYDSASTTKTLNGGLPFYIDGTWSYQTHCVGPYQDDDTASTQYVNSAYRFDNNGLETPPVKLSFITTPGGTAANKITASFNDIVKVGNTGGSRSYQQASMIVGDNGGLWFYRNTAPHPWPARFGVTDWTKETTGTIQNLYSVYANDLMGTDYTAIACGGFGTIIKSDRSGTTVGTWSSKGLENADATPFTKALNAVAGDDTTKSLTSVWVAVGETGSLFSSLDNGETWTIRELKNGTDTITSSLRDVRYGGGKWIAVGDGCIVLTSTDTITWEVVTVPAAVNDRNLYSVDYSPVHQTFNIGGDAVVLNSGASTLNFTATLTLSADETYSLERLWYRGSNANAQSFGTAVAVTNRLINGQTVSSTIIDTKYKKGDELGYYLIVGNIKGGIAPQEVLTGGSVITATEYKK